MEAKKNGTCFSDSGSFLLMHRDWTLVHGIPTLQVDPYKRYAHAWVEKDGFVMDVGKRVKLPAAIYYLIGKINPIECNRYTFQDMLEMISKHGHWGPWELPGDIL